MLRRLLTTAWLVSAIMALPMTPLVCGGADRPEAAACCRLKANECNRAGMTDDCCRTVPGTDEGSPTVAKAGPAVKLDRIPVLAAGVFTADSIAVVSLPARFRSLPADSPPDPSPPRPAVLRL